MLILSRRINENIIINGHIKLSVLSIQGQQVKLGFDAPKDIEVHREEVFNRIQEEKNRAIFEGKDQVENMIKKK